MRGYALMQNAEVLESAWLRSPQYGRNAARFEEIRAKSGLAKPGAYRGVERFPFTEWPERGPGWQGAAVIDPDPEPTARALLLEALGHDTYEMAEPRAVLSQLGQAAAVLRAIREPGGFELVELTTGDDACTDSLGFDVGYWGGGNFSILCDVAIWPTWHPPSDDALERIASFVAQLNDSLLFPSRDPAQRYRDWYAGQSWAEDHPEDFEIIEVGCLAPTVVAQPTP